MEIIKGFKLTNVALATALTLGLTACGSGDSTPSTTTPPAVITPPVDTPPSDSPTNVVVDIDKDFETFGGVATTLEQDSLHGEVTQFTIGSSPSVAGFQAASPIDLSNLGTSGALSFDLKVVTDAVLEAATLSRATSTLSAVKWFVKLESHGGDADGKTGESATVEITAPYLGEWQAVEIALSDLEAQNLDLTSVDNVMVFPEWGQGAGAVYQIANMAFVGEGEVEVPDLPPSTIQQPEGDVYLYHSDYKDSLSIKYWGDTWGSGSTYTVDDENRIINLNSGTEWGNMASINWGNEPAYAVDISAYTHVKYKVKATNLTQTEVIVVSATQGTSKIGYLINKGTPLDDGWVEIEAVLPGYEDMTWFGLTFNDNASKGSVLLSDIQFVTQDIEVVGPDVAAPIPQPADAEPVVLYSDTLASDKFISVWNSNWWNAPIYSQGEIDGNNYAKYQITDLGTVGGVVGLEFGIEYGVLDASTKTAMNFDMYVETGISRISVQLSSDAGNAFYEITNPITGEWISHEAIFAQMGGAKEDLDTSTLKFIGLQLWGEAGQSIYVDNIYFAGEAVMSDLDVTVKDSNNNVIPNAKVSVGSLGTESQQVVTDANGLATLNMAEGQHKIYVDVEGMAIAKQVQSNVGGQSMVVNLEPLNPQPASPAPVPTISNEQAYSIYSDTLTADNYISYWEDNWWNAPRFSQINIAGNNTARFQVLPDGVAGGVTGIQYGIPNVVNVADKTGMHFNVYATEGVTKLEFQVLSEGGNIVRPMPSPVTGEWVTVELDFADYDIDPATLSQLGLAIHGTTKDTVYLDNIYFY